MSDFRSISEATAEIDAIDEWLMHAGDELASATSEVEAQKIRKEIDFAREAKHTAEVWLETRN